MNRLLIAVLFVAVAAEEEYRDFRVNPLCLDDVPECQGLLDDEAIFSRGEFYECVEAAPLGCIFGATVIPPALEFRFDEVNSTTACASDPLLRQPESCIRGIDLRGVLQGFLGTPTYSGRAVISMINAVEPGRLRILAGPFLPDCPRTETEIEELLVDVPFRPSSAGTFRSCTVDMNMLSEEKVDAIYAYDMSLPYRGPEAFSIADVVIKTIVEKDGSIPLFCNLTFILIFLSLF